MAQVRFWIATRKVGSKCEIVMEIPDDETDDAALEDVGKDVIWNMAEWGYEIIPQ